MDVPLSKTPWQWQRATTISLLVVFILAFQFWFGSQQINNNNNMMRRRSWTWATGQVETQQSLDAQQQQQHQQTGVGYYPHLVHLPLLPWEIESITTRTCRPPTGVPQQCCIGSISTGGEVYFDQTGCDKGIATYNRLEERALQLLEEHFPQSTRKNATNNNHQIRCDICRIVDLLVANNWTLAFEGDSMTSQTFVGLECELRRRGYEVTKNVTKLWVDKKKPRWRFGLDGMAELIVRRQQSPPPLDQPWTTTTSSSGETTAATGTATAVIRLYSMYRPMEDLHEIEQICRDNDILVFDNGLHYGAETPYEWREHMTDMIQKTLALPDSSVKLLLWRETSAQHFNTSGGHYYPNQSEKCVPPPVVVPAEKNVTASHFRTHLTKQLLQELGATAHLKILPFHEYTKNFYELHKNANTIDCTHFCSTPSLWLYLWRSLRLALEEISNDG